MDCVIGEQCYKEIISRRHHRKMTILWSIFSGPFYGHFLGSILWSFSYDSFVKFHGKKVWEPNQIFVIMGTALLLV